MFMLLQDNDCEIFYLLNPEQVSLRAGVEHLRTTYPQVPVDSLHNVLAIVNGDIKAASQVYIPNELALSHPTPLLFQVLSALI